MIFRTENKEYYGTTALDIVRAMESDARDYPHRGQSLRRFLGWSLRSSCGSRLPPRDTHLSDRLDDEELALHYLCLRDEFGVGRLLTDSPIQSVNTR